MKTQLKNRILSLTLSAAMLLSMFPSFTLPVGAAEAPPSASADGTGAPADGKPADGTGAPADGAPAALTAETTLLSLNPSDGNIDDATELTNAFAAGGSYTVTTAFAVSSTVTLSTGKEVTLDLNGKAITAVEGITPITVAGGTLRITDGTMSPGSITGGTGANGGGSTGGNGITVTSGELWLQGGVAAYSITGGAGSTGAGGNGIDAAGGTVTITGAPVITGGAGGDSAAGGIGVKIATGAQLGFLDNSNPVVIGGAGGDSTSGVGGNAGDGISSAADFRIWNGTFVGGLGGSGATDSAGGVGGDAVYGNGITTIRNGSFTGGNGGAGNGSGNGGLAGTGVAVESVSLGSSYSNAIAEIRKNGTDSGTFIGGAGGTSGSGTGGKGGFGVGGWAGASVQILEGVTKASFTGGNGGSSSTGSVGTTRAKVGSTEANYVSYINDLNPAVVTDDTALTTYAVSYYMNKDVADTYAIWYVGKGCEPLDLGAASGTTAPPDGGNRTFADWVTAAASQDAYTSYDFGSTISAATSIYALWREETNVTGAAAPTKKDTYLQQILTVNNLATKDKVTQGTVSGNNPTPAALGTFGSVAYNVKNDGTYAAQFDLSDTGSGTAKRNAVYNQLKTSNTPVSYTAAYTSANLSANPIVKSDTSSITMNFAASQALFLDEDTVNTNGCIAIGMAAPTDGTTTYTDFTTALTKNPTHMITGQTYDMTIALRDLAADATTVNTKNVHWYKQAFDGTSIAECITTNTVTQGSGVTFVSAPIIVDTGSKYFAVIDNIKYFNTDPACLTPHADIGNGKNVRGLRTGDTRAIPVTAGDDKIKTGVLSATADIGSAAATDFTVGTAYTLKVDPATVTDYRAQPVKPDQYTLTYQKSENGAVWEDLADEKITPANTTCLYRAKLVPTKDSGLIGTFYTNILRTTTAKDVTLALTTDKATGFDHESVQLTATTNTANVGEVQFYQSANGTAWTYLATVPVKTGKADYTVFGLKPQGTAYTFKAFYLANTEFNAADDEGDKSFTVSSSAIKPNTTDGRTLTASPALKAGAESTLTVEQPMNAANSALTITQDYTVAWYVSANGTAWAELAGEADGSVKVTPQSDKTMYFARISPAGNYKSGGFETNPIGKVERVNTATTLAASPAADAAYESGTLTLTATVKDAAATNQQTIIGGTVTFYVGTTQVGTASLVSEKAIIAIPMPKAGMYGAIRADYSGTEKYSSSTGALASYTVKSATLPTTKWEISGTPKVGEAVTLTLTATTTPAVILGTDYTIRWEVYNGTSWSTLANSVGTDNTYSVTAASANYKYRAVVFPMGAYTQPTQGLIVNAAGIAATAPKATTVTLAVDKATPFVNETITLTAKVTETTGSALVSGGFVTFNDGTNDIGTAPVGADGIAALTIAAPATDTDYTATYTGDNVVYASSTVNGTVSVAPQSVTIAVTGKVIAKYGTSSTLGDNEKLVAETKYTLTVPTVTQSDNSDRLDYGDHYLVDWQENYKGGGWKYLSTAETIDVIPADDFYQYRAVVRPAGPFSQPAAGITLGSVDGKDAKTASAVALAFDPADGAIYEGQKVKVTATVTPKEATGTVEFFLDGATVGTASLTGTNPKTAVYELTIPTAGDHAIKAIYSGDTLYASSELTEMSYTAKSATIVLNGAADTIGITLKGDTNPVNPGNLVAGTTYTLTAPSVYASDDTGFTAALENGKNYTIEWQYTNQDAAWHTINGTDATIDVQPQSNQYQYRCVIMPKKGADSPFIKPEAGITVTATGAAQLIPTVTTLAADPATQFEGKTVKLTATVKHSTDKLVPSGTVTFYRCDAAGNNPAALETLPLANGTVSYHAVLKPWATGDRADNFYAVYNGNTTYATSQSGATATTVTVQSATLAAPTFAVTGTRDTLPLNTAHVLTLGDVKTLDDAVLAVGTYSVQWQSSANGVQWGDIPGATERTYTTPANAPNDTQFRVKVAATANEYSKIPKTSIVNAKVTSKLAPTVSLTTSAAEAYENSKLTLTANVTHTGTTPTGSVTFYQGTSADAAKAIATVVLDANGKATCETTVLGYTATDCTNYFVQYTGDSIYTSKGAQSTAITVWSTTVAAPTFTVTNPAGVTDVINRSTLKANTPYTFTLDTVKALDGRELTAAGATYNVQWQSSMNGTAWTDIAGATDGTYVMPSSTPLNTQFRVKVTAATGAFVRDAKYSAQPTKVSAKAASQVTLTTNVASIYENATIKLTANVPKAAGVAGSAIPQGSVTFYYGSNANTSIATVVLDANGQATCDATVLPWTAGAAAPNTVTYYAVYSGNDVYEISVDTSSDVTVYSTTFAVPTFTVSDGVNDQEAIRNALPTNVAYVLTAGDVTRLDGVVITNTKTEYTLQWQISTDGANWKNISGATSASYKMPITTEAGTQFRLQVAAQAQAFVKGTEVSTDRAKIAGGKADSDTTLTTDVHEQYEFKTVKLTAVVEQQAGKAMPTGTVTFYRGVKGASPVALETVTLVSGQAILKDVKVPAWTNAKGENARDEANYYAEYSGDAVYLPTDTDTANKIAVAVKSTAIVAPTFKASHDGTDYTLAAGDVFYNGMTAGIATELKLQDVKSKSGETLAAGKDYTISWQMKKSGTTIYVPISGATVAEYAFTAGSDGDSYIVRIDPVLSATGNMLTGADSMATRVANIGTRLNAAIVLDAKKLFDASGAEYNAGVGAKIDGAHFGQSVVLTATVAAADRTNAFDLIADGGYVVFYDGTASDTHILGTANLEAKKVSGGVDKLIATATFETSALAIGEHTINAQFVSGKYYNPIATTPGTAYKVWSTTMDTDATYRPTIVAATTAAPGTPVTDPLTAGTEYALTLGDVYTESGEKMTLGQDYYILWQVSTDSGKAFREHASTEHGAGHTSSTTVTPLNNKYVYRAVVVPYDKSVKLDEPANGYTTNTFGTAVDATGIAVTSNLSEVYFGNAAEITAKLTPTTLGNPTGGHVYFYYSTANDIEAADYEALKPDGTGTGRLQYLSQQRVPDGIIGIDGKPIYSVSITTDKLPLAAENRYQPVYLYAFFTGTSSAAASQVTTGAPKVDVYSSTIYGDKTGTKTLATPSASTEGGIVISAAGDILVGDGAETTLSLKPIYTVDAKSKTLDNLVTADVPAGTILPQAVLANSTDYVVTWQVAQNYTGANSVWQDITDAKNTTAVVRPTTANFAYRAMITATPSDKTRASGTATAKYYSNVLTVGTANAVVQMAISPSSSYFAANTDGTETVNPSETAEENKTLVDVFVSGGSTTPTGSVTLSGTKQGSVGAAFAPMTYSLATGGSHLQFEVKDLPAGIYTLKVVYTGNSGYQTSEVQETYIVRYKPQLEMNAADLAKIYDGKATEIAAKNFAVTAKQNDTLPQAILDLANLAATFRFERLGADGTTWSWTDKAVDAGKYRVKAVLPESKYYLKSASDFVEFTISKRELAITDVVYQAKTYDAQATAYPLSVQLAHDNLGSRSGHGIIVDDSVFVTGTAAYKTAAAGEASVTFTPTALNGADMDNYVLPAAYTEDNTYPIGRSGLTVNSKDVTDTALSALKVYDASGREMPRSTAADGYNVRYYYHDGSGVKQTADLSRKGKYTVVVAPTDTANFKGGESFVMNVDAAVTFDGNDTVAPAIPTLVLFTGTQFEFNDKDQSAAVKSTNAASAIMGNTAKKTPGRYAAEAATAVETQSGILSIFKAEQPAKATPSVTVGGANVTELVFGTDYVVKPNVAMPTGTYFTFVGDNIPGVAYEQPTDAGEYLVTLHVPATENYVAYTTSSKFLITKAPITIAAVAAKKQQYTTNPRWTATYTGSAAADFGEYRDMLVIPSYTLMASDANANADLTTPGNYSLTPAKAYSKNYEVTGYADSVFTIEVSSANLSEQLKLVGEPFGNIYYGDEFTLSAYGNYGLLSANITQEPANTPDGAAAYVITNSQPTKEKVSNSSTLKYEVVDGSAVATIHALTGKVETKKSGYFTVKLTRGTGVDAIYTYKTYHVGTQNVGVYMKAEDVIIYNGAVQGLTEDKYQTNLGGTLPVTRTVIYSGTSATPQAAGNYLVDITYSNGQYSGSGTGLLVIQQKAATVASNAVPNKTYGDAVAVTGYSETDKAVVGDSLLEPAGTTKVNMKASSDVGKYEIFTAGAVNPNYVLSYTSADYGVIAKALTVEAGVDGATINTVTAQNMREYGKVNPTMGYQATGFIDGDGLADLTISDAANPAFVTYAKLQESDANREGGNAHAEYVNGNADSTGYGITLYAAVANQAALNYTLTQQDGVLDIYQAPVKLTVVSLTVPSGKKLVQKDFFAKADPLLTAAPMSDKLADLGIQYLVAGTVVPDAGYTTAANDTEKAISATIKTGTKTDAQNYWLNPAQTGGMLRVSENKRHTAITLGRTSSTAVVTEDVNYLPVYKYTEIKDPTDKTADEMKATGWYVRSDAAKWATKDYNAVSGEGVDATATYTFFNSDGTQKFAKGAKVPDGGNYFVLEGDASTLTKTVNSDIGNLHFYIFDANGSVVREGNMTTTAVGVYTATYASLPDGTYRIVLSALPATEFKSRAAGETYYTLDPYTTETTLSGGGGDPVDPGPGPGPGPSGGGTTTTPILETKDHFAYIIGDENGKFNAIVDMTRAEAATVFYRLLKDKTYTASSSFRDVTTNDWFYDEVMALAAKDIIKGYSTGEFKPSASITRAEFCAMASRFFELSTGKVLEFDDVSTNHWAYQYILSAAEKGWVNGYKNSDGTFSFKPENQITRAEVVKIVNAMLGRAADKTYVQKHADTLAKFSDLTSTYWAYYDIMEAANGHLYTMDKEGRETWSGLK